MNDALMLFQVLGQVLLDTKVDDTATRAVSFARIPEAILRATVEETARSPGAGHRLPSPWLLLSATSP
jgi:hypothetical protein